MYVEFLFMGGEYDICRCVAMLPSLFVRQSRGLESRAWSICFHLFLVFGLIWTYVF